MFVADVLPELAAFDEVVRLLPATVFRVLPVVPHIADDAVPSRWFPCQIGGLHRRGDGGDQWGDMEGAIFFACCKSADERGVRPDMTRGQSDDIENCGSGGG